MFVQFQAALCLFIKLAMCTTPIYCTLQVFHKINTLHTANLKLHTTHYTLTIAYCTIHTEIAHVQVNYTHWKKITEYSLPLERSTSKTI